MKSKPVQRRVRIVNGFRVVEDDCTLHVQDLATPNWVDLPLFISRASATKGNVRIRGNGQAILSHPWLATAFSAVLTLEPEMVVRPDDLICAFASCAERNYPVFPIPMVSMVKGKCFPFDWDVVDPSVVRDVLAVALELAWKGGRMPGFELEEALLTWFGCTRDARAAMEVARRRSAGCIFRDEFVALTEWGMKETWAEPFFPWEKKAVPTEGTFEELFGDDDE